MFISKAELQAIKFSSVDESRPQINGLHITETKTIATDGHRLIVIERGKIPEFNRDGFPVDVISPALPITISRQSVETIIKAWPKIKKRDVQPVHEWGFLKVDSFTVLDANYNQIAFPIAIVSGPFPQWDRVLPKPEDRPERIGVNVNFLSDSSYMADKKTGQIEIRTNTETESALLIGQNSQGQDCQQVVMPMRLDSSEKEIKDSAIHNKLLELGVDAYLLHETLRPIDKKELVKINGNHYLKSDIDALIQSKELATV